MSTSPSNSNTSATSSADAQERFIAAALIAHEAHLVAGTRNLTGDIDKAREAVMAAFLELCRQSPDQFPDGAKDWLEATTAKRARKLAPKGSQSTAEDVRWKRVAGTGEAAPETPAAPLTLLPSQRETILHAARLGVAQPDRPSAYPRWVLPMVGVTVGVIALVMFLKRPESPEPVTPSPAPIALAPAAATPSPAVPQAPASTPAAPPPTVPLEALLLPLPGPALTSGSESQPALSTAAANARLRKQALDAAPGDFLAGAAAKLAATPDLDLTKLPEVSPRPAIQATTSRQLPLPVLAGTASLGWISSSVTGKHQLPPAKAVRLEEILNALSLKPGGTAAISKGASVVAESFSCPWKPSATLLMVRVQGAADGQRTLEALLDLDPAAVSQFRLLGYSPVKDLENATLPGVLPAKTGTTLLIEIAGRADAKDLGVIRWKVDGKDAAPLPVQQLPESEPTQDARFAALLAAWSAWLVQEQLEIFDEDLVSGLARECAAGDLPKDRRDVLVLIARSLELR